MTFKTFPFLSPLAFRLEPEPNVNTKVDPESDLICICIAD